MAYANGLVPTSALRAVDTGQYLRKAAARDWFAMATAAALAGITLTVTSTNRTNAEQVTVFNRNYTTTPNGSNDVRLWPGHGVYYRRIGSQYVSAAVPGTSNHGLAIAIDIGGVAFGYGATPTAAYTWLKKNEAKYGYLHPAWAETQRDFEPWHHEHASLTRKSKRLPTQYLSVAKIKALQSQLDVPADGIISVPSGTVKAMQKRINADAHAAGIKTALKVDGLLGPHTIQGLKKWLNWKVKPTIRLKPASTKWSAHAEHVLRKTINKKKW